MTPAPSDDAPACFGLRRVNPFLGVVAVVQTSGARAFTIDGRRWQVQVAAHPPRGLWSGGGEDETWRWFQFGHWGAADGLTHVPLNPILDLGRMLAAADALTSALCAHAAQIPFPLAPERECWLLDRSGAPIALLDTARADADAAEPTDLPGDWAAGGRGERPFTSAVLAERDQGRPTPPAAHAEYLERGVRAAAGRPRAAWFARAADGSGRLLGADAPPRPATDFPPLTLCTDWPDPLLAAVSAEYIAWLAPWLLTLPTLAPAARAMLEASAARDATTMDALWPLYPEVQDSDLLKRVRVEARLRRTHPVKRTADGPRA